MTLWKLLAHITIPSTNPSSRGATFGYLNVVTWADSAHAAEAKVITYFETLNWQILNFENADTSVLTDDFTAEDDHFQQTIERARQNSGAIAFGTFHSYRPS